MFLQEVTPDTSGYMIAGYAIAFIVMSLYVISLYLRNRNLKRDLETLEELDESSAQPEIDPPKSGKKEKKETKTVTKRGQKKQS